MASTNPDGPRRRRSFGWSCRLAERLRDRLGLILVIVAGEETGCDGSRHLASVAGALSEAGAIVIAEPTGNCPYVGHTGALWLHAHAIGVTAHGSMPDRGVNAIYKATRAVTKLERFDFQEQSHPVLGSLTLNVGTIIGGLNINSVPDEATIGIDIRTIPGQRHRAIVRQLSEYLGDDVTLAPIVDVASVWTDPAHPWMQEIFELTTSITAKPPAVRGAPYFTDASLLTPAFGGPPTVILGPGEMELAHQTNEYCRVDRLEQSVELYMEMARRWNNL